MFVYPPDVLEEREAHEWKDWTARTSCGSQGRRFLTDQDYQILFARKGLIFVGWEPYADSLAHNRFLAEVYPL